MSKHFSTKKAAIDPRDRRGIAISAAFSGKCRTAIQRAVGADQIVLRQHETPRGTMIFFNAPTTGSLALDAKVGEIPVLPLVRVPDSVTTIWIAPSFRRQGSDLVDSVTLRLYEGGLSAHSKKLLVRAEWDLNSSERSRASGHAQPHWHFHIEATPQPPAPLSAIEDELALPKESPAGLSSLSALAAALRGEPQESLAQIASADGTESDALTEDDTVHGVHFPMAANWNTVPMTCVAEHADEKALYYWLEAVTRYIRGQFQSLYGMTVEY